MSASKTPSVPAVERALGILEMLAESRNGLTLSQLVEQSGLPKSSLHCLLLTLERCGYLHRNERTSRYMFGVKLFSLANTSLSGLRLREQAIPFLVSLMQQTRLTVHMGILEQYEAVLIAKYDPPGHYRLATWLGKRMEAHCTGLGKVLAAYMPEEDLDQLIQVRGFPRHNENTLITAKRFKEEMAKVRRQGFALDDEEDEIGLRCIGAPVFDETGAVAAAVSIAGTTYQINSENLSDLAFKLKSCALSISQTLGYKNEVGRTG